jgi:hypothetical protein
VPNPLQASTEDINPTSEVAIDFENDLEDFDPNIFDHPTNVDNQWFPPLPGTRYIYEGITEEGEGAFLITLSSLSPT